ncbi:MAG: hypothetical protein M3P43_06735 [Actinomycetota bacterium]|nr:hypothetical protein [Actinomycetota bacterium]
MRARRILSIATLVAVSCTGSAPREPSASRSQSACTIGTPALHGSTSDGANVLAGVDVLSARSAWAVGFCRENGAEHTLVQRWDGTGWRRVGSPNEPSGNTYLTGVSAVAGDDVWAVGAFEDGPRQGSVTVHWDGRSWKRIPAPALDTFYGVSASGPGDVWTVGSVPTDGTANAETSFSASSAHWNGQRWQSQPVPSPGSGSSRLSDVDARTPNDAWAVGEYVNTGTALPLVVRWDGRRWRIVHVPLSRRSAILTDVVAFARDDVWVVGGVETGTFQALAAHWDGRRWREFPGVALGGGSGNLAAADGSASDDVWAAGYRGGPSDESPLLLHWDGSIWTPIAITLPSGTAGELTDVMPIAPGDAWVTGYLGSFEAAALLIDRPATSL